MIFEPGDKVLLVDGRGRRYLITLQQGGSFHFHRGIVSHDEVIGRSDGVVVKSSGNETLAALRPTYADYVMKMKRGAQVIYPKDVAMILLHGDIFPGASILEAGVGSGALTIALLRAVGPQGRVVACDVREDFIQTAQLNIEGFLGKTENLVILHRDVYEPLGDMQVDRVVLDLAEPWRALANLDQVLVPGGIGVFYLPTILQVSRLTDELRDQGRWTSITTLENLTRTWHIEGRSVRPDHRMVAHTGFITFARLLEGLSNSPK